MDAITYPCHEILVKEAPGITDPVTPTQPHLYGVMKRIIKNDSIKTSMDSLNVHGGIHWGNQIWNPKLRSRNVNPTRAKPRSLWVG